MKHRGIRILTAALLICTQLSSLSVSAEGETPDVITPIYSLDKPAACDMTISFASDMQSVAIRVYQSSPEREKLLYAAAEYESADAGKEAVLLLEPGTYAIEIETRLLAENTVRQMKSLEYQLDDPDDAGNPKYSYLNICISENEIEDTESADALPPISSVQTSDDGIVLYVQKYQFGYYNRTRGDYNGDGKVSSLDSMRVLIDAADARAGYDTPDMTPGRLAACDIDGNGKPDIKDAQYILRYAGDTMIGLEPSWPN